LLLLRLDEGLSQEELAARAGMRQSVISRIETGESEPRIDTVNKIAKALNRKVKNIKRGYNFGISKDFF
jgi:transcriptional regulator with XRE-family HTH domain